MSGKQAWSPNSVGVNHCFVRHAASYGIEPLVSKCGLTSRCLCRSERRRPQKPLIEAERIETVLTQPCALCTPRPAERGRNASLGVNGGLGDGASCRPASWLTNLPELLLPCPGQGTGPAAGTAGSTGRATVLLFQPAHGATQRTNPPLRWRCSAPHPHTYARRRAHWPGHCRCAGDAQLLSAFPSVLASSWASALQSTAHEKAGGSA